MADIIKELFVPIGGSSVSIQTPIGVDLYNKRSSFVKLYSDFINKKLKSELNENFINITEGISGEVKSKISASDDASFSYKFRSNRPAGVLISDTYNHFAFPLTYPRIDNSKMLLQKISLQFRENYSKISTKFLPWHYMVEMVNGEYVIYNTRPIDVRFPIGNDDVLALSKSDKIKLNSDTKAFLKRKNIDMQDCIHICIVGDTGSDIYTDKIYKIIGRFCIHPILQLFRLPKTLGTSVQLLNIGNKFKGELLERHFKK